MEISASAKGYQIINLEDMILELGEDMTKHILLNFSCPLNRDVKNENLITGDELLKMACDKINEIQLIAGGSIVYIECEDVQKLKEFYLRNGFVEFGRRKLDNDEKDDLSGEYLIQMVKYLHKDRKTL